ncbi:class F sortase [Pseudonocardia sp. HH130630-07]|uniref:class F sortase n=1 Tax=Pseudonocardia sp. HH130630-07 TaxID=1690815 RepID=UPI0009F19F8D|nr:class F sortase [Pseudonocardia sp. HH130630-07]
MSGRTHLRRPGALLLPGVVVLVLVLVGCAGGPGTAPVPAAPTPSAPAPSIPPPSAGEPVEPGTVVPTSVSIPGIGVEETAMVRLGVAADGSAEVPQDYGQVGWFDRRGNPGPTVLMGHVDSRSGPAVFFDLRDLRPGDEIEVGYDDGRSVRYAVERTQQVPKDAFPTFEVFGGGGTEALRLVTCAGEFDRGERSYTDNLVIHARPG